MRPFGTARELEQRRLLAMRLLSEGKSAREVASRVRADPRSVRRWHAAARADGDAGLAARPTRGRPRRLTAQDLALLHLFLAEGAKASASAAASWSCARVTELIQRQFGVHYHPAHVSRILHRLGIMPRKPYP